MSHRTLLVALVFAASCRSASVAPERDLDPGAPVARVGGKVITGGELNDLVAKDLKRANMEYREKVYQLRKQALDNLINKKLLEPKAQAAGMDPDAFAAKEIAAKVKEPTDQEIQALYDEARAHGQQLPPIEQVRPRIIEYLNMQRRQSASGDFYAQLRKDANVQVMLPTFKRDVETVGPSKGPKGAPVTIVEFSDFECPFCSRAEETVTQVLSQYKDKIRLVYRDFPLPMHPHAQKASEAALCADEQGKYWQMHEKLFQNQGALEVASLKGYAKALNLDTAKFEKCLDSGDKAKLIEASKKAGEELGVQGTPAFFINGQFLNGAQPIEAFKAVIDPELASK